MFVDPLYNSNRNAGPKLYNISCNCISHLHALLVQWGISDDVRIGFILTGMFDDFSKRCIANVHSYYEGISDHYGSEAESAKALPYETLS